MCAERRAIEARYPVPRATMNDLMAHILHTLKLVGADHVGIGLDLDGGGGVTGLDDVEDIPEITRRLLAAGYSEADLAKIWSGNVLRLLREADAKATAARPISACRREPIRAAERNHCGFPRRSAAWSRSSPSRTKANSPISASIPTRSAT